jgi:ferredoxin-type protein NapH
MKIKWLRVAVGVGALGIFLSGVVCKSGAGTLCSLSIAGIPFTCPLGFLQKALASKSLSPQLWIGASLVLLSVLLLGRFFCAWICPTALLRQALGVKTTTGGYIRRTYNHHGKAGNSNEAGTLEPVKRENPLTSYSGFALLAGALISSFIFGFPVFCLICPVGLFYGSLFALSRLIVGNQPSVELFILPTLLGLELFGMRSWCSSICPLGALLGLLARFNYTLRLRVDPKKCLVSEGVQCQACKRACLYGFNISQEKDNPGVNACAKCFECYENCPAKAIRFHLTK